MRTLQTIEQCNRVLALGYDRWGVVISEDHDTHEKEMLIKPMNFPYATPSPLIADVFEWACEEKKIFVDIYPRYNPDQTVTWHYQLLRNLVSHSYYAKEPRFDTYRDAQDAALAELLLVLEAIRDDNT